MRKFICALLAAALMLAPAALAEEKRPEELTAQAGIIALENNAQIDLDEDGAADSVTYELVWEDDFLGTFNVQVNGASLSIYTENGIDQLYAGRLNGEGEGIFLLVGEMGPSDDPYSHILRYGEGALTEIGGIPALPEDIAINGNVLTATVRASKIQTWYREGDFVIARSYLYDEDYNPLPPRYYVAESPRASYAMNTAVVLKRDLALTTALFGGQTLELKQGETAILTATDDNSYVYMVPADRAAHDWLPGGYLMLGDDFASFLIDGELVSTDEVLDGLIFAD